MFHRQPSFAGQGQIGRGGMTVGAEAVVTMTVNHPAKAAQAALGVTDALGGKLVHWVFEVYK